MKTRKLRLLSFVLAVAMMFAVMPVSAFATEGKKTTPSDGHYEITVTEKSDTEDAIADKNHKSGVQKALEAEYEFSSDEDDRFDAVKSLTVRTAPGIVLNKADFQFLSGVKVNSTTSYNYAGGSNVDTTYYWLRNLTEVDLTNANLKDDKFPDRAFCKNTKIKVVIFPNTLQSSGFKTFAFASALEYVGTREGLGASSEESTIKFPASMTKIGESCFYDDSNLKCTLELPATVKTLGTNAFEGSAVKADKLLIRNTVTFEAPASGQEGTEHANTFYGTNIKSIELEEGITEIPNGFVGNCWELNSITIPSTVTKIGNGAFKCASTKIKDTIFSSDLVIPDKVVSLGTAAIDNIGHVSNIIVENPNVTLGQYCFYHQSSKIYFTANDIENTNEYWDSDSTRLFTDGGKVTPNSTETYENTGLYIPVKDGYKFNGWYDTEDKKLTTAAEAGKTYYAKWAELHTVTFDDADVEPVKVAHGEQLEKPADPKKDGYKFDYWCDANGNEVNFPLPINADITLTAKWHKYNITTTVKETTNADQKNEIGKPVDIAVTVTGDATDFDIAKLSLNFDKPEAVKEVKLTLNSVDIDGQEQKIDKALDLTEYKNANEPFQHMELFYDESSDENESSEIALHDAMPKTLTAKMILSVVYSAGGKNNVEIVFEDGDNYVVSRKTAEIEVAYAPESLNLTGCTAKLENDTPVKNGAKVPVGAEVTVTFEPDADSDLVLNGWNVTPETLTDINGKLVKDITADTFTFKMPETDEGVTIAAQTKAKAAAPAEDDSLDAATVVTGVVLGTGTAILAYHIGTEVYAEQVLGKGVAIPRTREEVALKAWELAGKPAVELNGEPLSEAAQAEKWAVESGLMQNVDGSFNGSKKMSKLKALRTLDAAKKLG